MCLRRLQEVVCFGGALRCAESRHGRLALNRLASAHAILPVAHCEYSLGKKENLYCFAVRNITK